MTLLARRLQNYCPDRALWPLRESRALHIFRRKAHNYLSDNSALADDLRCLALMQNHGISTHASPATTSPSSGLASPPRWTAGWSRSRACS